VGHAVLVSSSSSQEPPPGPAPVLLPSPLPSSLGPGAGQADQHERVQAGNRACRRQPRREQGAGVGSDQDPRAGRPRAGELGGDLIRGERGVRRGVGHRVHAISVGGDAAAEPLVVRTLLTAARNDDERAAGGDAFGFGPGDHGDVLI
jgi:hypothetical protein